VLELQKTKEITMAGFRIKQEKLQKLLDSVIAEGMPTYKDYALKVGKSASTIGDGYDEIRRAFKRGDMIPATTEIMEFFLRTSPREAKILDKAKV